MFLTVRRSVALLAGEEPHHVPVPGKDAQLHQVAEHTEDLEQELLSEGTDAPNEASISVPNNPA